MRECTLVRQPTTDQGTFGILTTDKGAHWFSGELPWRDNHPQSSCVPAGVYLCQIIQSPKHGECYQLKNVVDRSYVEIHSANFAGDVSKGWKSELLGCIMLGKTIGKLANDKGISQTAILASKTAIGEFMNHMAGSDFMLTIKDSE